MPLLPASGGAQNLSVVNQEGSSAVETHDMCVCSTLYHTMPNMPATSGEYHNEARQMSKAQPDPWMVLDLNG